LDPARRGAPSRSGGCTQPARCAPRWRSMLYVQCCTPPPSSPETGVCVEIRWWQPGRYFGRRGLVVAVGDAHQIRMLTRAILVCAESWRCCTSENRAFATILPGLDLCFVGWCWLGGWAFITSVEGDGIVQHHMSILTRAFLVCSEFRAALAVCCCRKSRFILFRLGDGSRGGGWLQRRRGGLHESGFCASSFRRAPRFVFSVLISRQPPLTGAVCANFGQGSAVCFSRGASVRGDSAASGSCKCRTPWIASRGNCMGSLCARGFTWRPAPNKAQCASRCGFAIFEGWFGRAFRCWMMVMLPTT